MSGTVTVFKWCQGPDEGDMQAPPREVEQGSVFRPGLWSTTALYVTLSLGLAALGFFAGAKALESIGFLLVAGTFVPLPFDLYVLHLAPHYPLLGLTVAAAVINTAAVLFERWFLLRLLAAGRGRRVVEVVQESRVSSWFRKAPFLALFVGGASMLPFEPFRFLAVVNEYRVDRYALATFLGRGVRLFVIIAVGAELARFDWFLLVIGALLVLYGVSLADARNIRGVRGIFARTEPVADPGEDR